MKAILGILSIILGVVYTLSLLKRNYKKENTDIWDKSMFFRGFLGGVALVILGIALILSNS